MSLSVKPTLKIYWQHVRRHKALMAAIILGMLLLNIGDVTLPLLYKRLFDVTAEGLSGDALVTAMLAVLVTIAAVHAGRAVLFAVVHFSTAAFQPKVKADLERSAFDYLIGHSYRFFSNAFAGSLVRRVHRLSRAFETFCDQIQWRFMNVSITTVGVLVIFASRSWIIAAVLAVWIAIFLSFNIAFARWRLPYDARRAEYDSESSGVLADAISNVVTIKQFSGFTFEQNIFRHVTEKVRKLYTFTWNLGGLNDVIQMAFMAALELAAMYVAVRLFAQGVLTIGDFILIQSALIQIFEKMWDFGRVIRHMYESFADAKEMIDIMEQPHEIVDRSNAKLLQAPEGRIALNDVTFAYNDKRVILSRFQLTIEPRQKVAVVGPSGAGKSTIIKLLLRFFDVTKGEILIDGQNIAQVTQDSLRDQVSLVPQDPILFHRTLLENIRYGRRDATDKEVIEAAKRAHCHEFISQLPNGYGTMVGERGVKLSGGERQRVAIARAILKNAPILILDEATSSLDSESEALIQEALHELMQDKTVIVIAHRLSTIMEMDRIVVIEKGKVTADGTHAELLKQGGTYAKLWSIQAGGFLP